MRVYLCPEQKNEDLGEAGIRMNVMSFARRECDDTYLNNTHTHTHTHTHTGFLPEWETGDAANRQPNLLVELEQHSWTGCDVQQGARENQQRLVRRLTQRQQQTRETGLKGPPQHLPSQEHHPGSWQFWDQCATAAWLWCRTREAMDTRGRCRGPEWWQCGV